MKKLDEALERVKPYLIDRAKLSGDTPLEDVWRGKDDHGYFASDNKLTPDEYITRLRLDWELSFDAVDGAEDVAVAELMAASMKNDLEDLIVNGDVDHPSDALLMTMNGSKKRGKDVAEVDIFSAGLYTEHKESKKMVEYTLYVLMYVRFE